MRNRAAVLTLLIAAALTAGACEVSRLPTEPDVEGDWIELFPTPISDTNTPFGTVDDDTLAVPFTMGFTFTFYGTTYDSIWLNTNGGFTFGNGHDDFNLSVATVPFPGVGVFWGDMDAGGFASSVNRAHQMRYEQQPDRFRIQYFFYQDHDYEGRRNSALVTLFADGTIVIEYAAIQSVEVLVGLWDGTHTDDRYVTLADTIGSYASALGTGAILFDYYDISAPQLLPGQLDGRTLTFIP